MLRYTLPMLALLITACGRPEAPPADEPTDESASMSAPAHDIRGHEVAYSAGGITLNGYLAYDAAQPGRRPGVLIVHEWWGHNDYVRERARMLAALGYTALAVDMYGGGKQAAHPDDAQKFMVEVLNNMDQGEARFRAAMAVLRDNAMTDPDKIAAIGYCFGGGIVLHMARIGTDLDGVASFHGMLATDTPAAPGAIKARLLVAHGADDPFVPAADVDAFKSEMAAAGADLKFIAYPGAVHGFTNPGATALGEKFNLPLRYDEQADHASWEELKKFLAEVFAD